MQLSVIKSIYYAFFLILCLTNNAWAASPFTPVYRVNSQVITQYDVEQMSKMLMATGTNEDLAEEKSVEFLIDSIILKAEIERIGLEMDPVRIERSLDRIAGGEGEGENLRKNLNDLGIADTTIDHYVQTQILLNTYLELKGLSINPTADEWATQIENIPDQVTETINLAEIVLPFQAFGGEISTKFVEAELRDKLQNGENFNDLAEEYSKSQTKDQGGRIPPIPVEALNPELSAILTGVQPGEVAPSLRTTGATILIKLVSYGEIRSSLPKEAAASFYEIPFSTYKEAENAGINITNCASAEDFSLKQGGQFFENYPLNSASSEQILNIQRLSSNEFSIVETPTGFELFYLCENQYLLQPEYQAAVQNMVSNEINANRARAALNEIRNLARIVKLN